MAIPPESSDPRPSPELAASLKAWRAKREFTQEELAKSIGVSKGFISGIENGKWGAGLETMQKLAAALDCTIDELLRPPDPLAFGVEEPVGRYSMIPHYNVRAGLGNAKINEHHIEVEADFPVPTSLIRRKGWRLEALRVITMVGDSMETTIYDGDPGVINTDFVKIRNGGVYAFIDSDGAMSVKRLHRERDGRVKVMSDNLNKLVYPDTWISPDDRIEILGELVHRSGSP